MSKKRILITGIAIFGGIPFFQGMLSFLTRFSDLFAFAALVASLLIPFIYKNRLQYWFATVGLWALATAGLAVAPKCLPTAMIPKVPALYAIVFWGIDPYVYAWAMALAWAIVPIVLPVWLIRYDDNERVSFNSYCR